MEPKWFVVDASDKAVGRLASDIAMILMGKHRPTYTPHLDTGDFVIVINVEKIKFTGKKWQQKEYTWTTNYPGLRSETADLVLKNATETRRLPERRRQVGGILKDHITPREAIPGTAVERASAPLQTAAATDGQHAAADLVVRILVGDHASWG